MPEPGAFTERQIREGIYGEYLAKFPRPGLEQENFVADNCAYFGITEQKCWRIMGEAQSANEAQFRTGIATASQAVGKAMGFTAAEVLATLRDSMRAVRKRPILANGSPLKDEKGELVFYEVPDHPNRIAACKEVAKILGLNAPKELHIEATHEHNVTISDADLIREFLAAGRGLGLDFVEARFEVAAGSAGSDASDGQTGPDPQSRNGLLRLADDDDANGG